MIEISLGWMIAAAVAALLVGVGVGALLPLGRGSQHKVSELQTELDASKAELADYRAEVYAQFAQTAEKFKRLDESYLDLHRQLATSAVTLVGEQGAPLLEVSPPLLQIEDDAAADDAIADETDCAPDIVVNEVGEAVADPGVSDTPEEPGADDAHTGQTAQTTQSPGRSMDGRS